jgi:hypothetical protein
MKKIVRFVAVASLGFLCATSLVAQDSQATSIPKVLQITREWIKPGRNGGAHEKTEAAYVQAMAKANWPTHYLAVTSMSGKSRALFMTRYDSFEALEKDVAAQGKNAALTSALDKANMADGELLDGVDQGIFFYSEEQSLRPRGDLSKMRFLEISLYQVRPGHRRDWDELVKMVKTASEKSDPDAHWGTFEQRYGGEGGSFLVLQAHKSLAEIDMGLEKDKKFAEAMGEEGMKKFTELYAAAVSGSQHQLFAFSPSLSYIYPEWAKADPEFWQAKPAANTMAKMNMTEKKTKP